MRRLLSGLTATLVAVPMIAVTIASAPPAGAQDNGLGLKPLLGWSSWSFIRRTPSAAKIEAQADAMVSSGLKDVGYQNVNVDDFWYQCPGSQGPNVDQFGRWVIDATKFPPNGSESGIKAVADYVHAKGLKFGLYMTPGISKQAVAQNTAIEGTPYHAADIATTASENNYNCKGMVGIDYSKPGAQEFINSWANQFASWDVDYLKLDGVGSFDVPDLVAWSNALRQTGRPIHLELSNNLAIGSAATWKQYANGWRTGGDVECYCGPGGSSYPLTDWSHVSSRFNQVANWAPYGGPGGFNDYDSIEVGNGANDGLTLDERKTQMSLWALAASPFILGTDLTNLDPGDLALLKNTDVLAVDQDAIDASRIANANGQQVFAKTEPNGDAIVGLFNTSGTRHRSISTSAATLGLPAGTDYLVKDLWSHQSTETTGVISTSVASHAVGALPGERAVESDAGSAARNLRAERSVVHYCRATGDVDGVVHRPRRSCRQAGAPQLACPGRLAGQRHLAHVVPVRGDRADRPGDVPGCRARAANPVPHGHVERRSRLHLGRQDDGESLSAAGVTTSPPVQALYLTYSSATDAPAAFGQSGQQFGISGAGADLFTNSDAYSTIYLKGAVGATSTVDTEVVSQTGLTGFGKAGIIVRNDATGSGTTPKARSCSSPRRAAFNWSGTTTAATSSRR